MSIKDDAQAIIDMCDAGPIPHGISVRIQDKALAVIYALQWTDAMEFRPGKSGEYQVKNDAGEVFLDNYDEDSGWWHGKVVAWREVIE